MGKLRKSIIGALALATVVGTWSGNDGGFPPFYTKKTGTTGGICVGVFTEFTEGSKFYGPSFSIMSLNKSGTVNGANLSFAHGSKGTTNGLEFSLMCNLSGEGKNEPKGHGVVNGLQASILYNEAKAGNCVQLGLINGIEVDGKKKYSPILNWGFDGDE